MFNLTSDTRDAELAYWGRDFFGTIIAEGTRNLTLAAAGSVAEQLDFTLPSARGMVFVEVSVTDRETGDEVFSRTNLTVLPPHRFQSTPENSLFGLAAYWPVPSEEEARRLMERMGVRWLRHGDNRSYGIAPDYPVQDPFAPWEVAPKGGFWNYYGSVKTAALMLREYGGDKPLWLTEIFAPTFPNSFWEDSMRHATENVVLTFALAKAENVKAAMWYQLFDSVWHDRFGANEKDREYHFGLVNRDFSLKPMVLAYATIAEALDGAEFSGWIRLPQPDARGMLFDTPRGPMAVLWSRKDGYTLSRKVPDFPSPEPWWMTGNPGRRWNCGFQAMVWRSSI